MDIVGGFDVHRKQITFDYIEMESGEVHRGKIQPADRENLRSWLEGFTERFCGKQAAIAVEATTGSGATSSRNFVESAWSLTWPSRHRPSPCRGARSAPRPIASTPPIYGICW